MKLDIKFRAKLMSGSSDNWIYGLPYVCFAKDVNLKEYAKWYLVNYELLVAEKTNSYHKTGEEYKSSYSFHIDINTLQVYVNDEWIDCNLPFVFTKNYQLIN